jgi:hypothetical protein
LLCVNGKPKADVNRGVFDQANKETLERGDSRRIHEYGRCFLHGSGWYVTICNRLLAWW